MKRDMDLVRKILFELGESQFHSDVDVPIIEGYSEDQIKHHVAIMRDAGLLTFQEGIKSKGLFGETEDLSLRLTWEGHEFLEETRDEGIWNSVVSTTKAKTGGVSFEVIKALLIATLTKAVGI